MSLLLWVLLMVLIVAVAGAGMWGYRYTRGGPEASHASADSSGIGDGGSDDLGGLQDGTPQARGGGSPGAEAGDSEAAAGHDDPIAAFGLDPEAWAPLSQRSRRVGYARGAFRGAGKPARLAGEPDAIFEHRDGHIAVGLDAGRPYQGHPQWREVSALTLQMGIAKMRWPKAEVKGLIHYTDCTVPVPYKPELFKDLRRAARSHKDKELPEANELATGETSAGGEASRSTGDTTGVSRSGLLGRVRGALARS